MKTSHLPQEECVRSHEETEGDRLYLYNDSVHSFDYVIHMLVKICGHTVLQAEQCAVITHHVGCCVVKTAPLQKLIYLRKKLTDGGLICEIK